MGAPTFIGKVKLTSQGQVTVPQEARKSLKILDEQDLYWYQLGSKLVITASLVAPEDLGLDEKKKSPGRRS